MKVIQINSYGATEVLEVNETSSRPAAGKGQILVEVYAASLNPFDAHLRAGYMKDIMPLSFPAILGGDFSGIVFEVGDAVTDFKTGDRVYGLASLQKGGSGSFAEFVTTGVESAAAMPAHLDFTEAASLPLTGVSALQALEDHIKLRSGQRILIHGGAGGIGSIAIQLAKSKGAFVATTVRAEDENFVRKLGADQVIDYRNKAFEDVLTDFDAVLDNAGGDATDKSFRVVKKGGVLVSMRGAPNPELAKKYGINAVGQYTNVDTPHLRRLADLVQAGKVKTLIDRTFSLSEIRNAFEYFEKNRHKGKVVLRVK